MFCEQCGKDNKETSRYCQYCGAQVVRSNSGGSESNTREVDKANGDKTTKVIRNIVVAILIGLFLLVLVPYVARQDAQKSILEDIDNIESAPVDKSAEFSELKGNLYRNTKYEFRIKFPEGWDIKDGDGAYVLKKAVNGNHSISVAVNEIPAEYANITNDIDTIESFQTIEEWKDEFVQGTKEGLSVTEMEVMNYGEAKLDNEPAYWVKLTIPYSVLDTTFNSTQITYQIFKNNKFYTISAGTLTDEYASAESHFMKSISTFVTEDF